MSATRRDFLHSFGASAVAYATLPLDALAHAVPPSGRVAPASPFDLTWPAKLTAPHRAVFDVPAIDSGFGVWRASLWGSQYMEFLNVKPTEMNAVIVLRAEGIVLAMQQRYWDAYHVGKTKGVKHPLTEQPTDRSPVLLSSARKEVPPEFDSVALDQFIKRGGIALACDVAFQEIVTTVEKAEKVKTDDARKRAMAMLVPGVLLQPSGVFAAIRAQEAGAQYLRSS